MTDRKWYRWLAGLCAVSVLAAVGSLPFLPDRPVAVHWNAHGVANGFAEPWQVALIGPLLIAAMALLFAAAPVIGPFRRSFVQSRRTWIRLTVALVGFLTLLYMAVLGHALGLFTDVSRLFAVLIGAMMLVLGNWLGKIRRNFWIGLRTPWTLANDRVWERTHRLGARLLVIIGLLALIGAIVSGALALQILVGGSIVLAVWSLGYSYWLYQRLNAADELDDV